MKNENQVDYNNLVFKMDGSSIIKNFDFLVNFGTLYDLLIYLLGNAKRIINSAEIQAQLFKVIDVLKTIISKMLLQIKVKNRKKKFLQNKRVF